jgi:hypothetical protein
MIKVAGKGGLFYDQASSGGLNVFFSVFIFISQRCAGFAAIKTNQRVTGFIAPNGDTKIGNLSSIPASNQ